MNFVSHKRSCKVCNATTNASYVIVFSDYYNDILIGKNGEIIPEQDLIELIIEYYKKNDLPCENCGAIREFRFYELKINDEPIIPQALVRYKDIWANFSLDFFHRNQIDKQATQKNVIDINGSVFMNFENFFSAHIYDIEKETMRLEFSKYPNNGLIAINKNDIMLGSYTGGNLTVDIKGIVTSIEFDDEGFISCVKGNTQKHYFPYFYQTAFIIERGVEAIVSQIMTCPDNFYFRCIPRKDDEGNEGFIGGYFFEKTIGFGGKI